MLTADTILQILHGHGYYYGPASEIVPTKGDGTGTERHGPRHRYTFRELERARTRLPTDELFRSRLFNDVAGELFGDPIYGESLKKALLRVGFVEVGAERILWIRPARLYKVVK